MVRNHSFDVDLNELGPRIKSFYHSSGTNPNRTAACSPRIGRWKPTSNGGAEVIAEALDVLEVLVERATRANNGLRTRQIMEKVTVINI